jgi:putative spermidine/putrescine transport system permease protein
VVLRHLGLESVLSLVLTIPAVGGNTLSTSGLGRFLVFVYIWLPFMILPVQAALERLPPHCCRPPPIWALVRARPSATWCCRWRFPALPQVRFYLLPDARRFYRAAAGGAAGVLYRQYGLFPAGAIGNMPMAAAFTLVPIVLIALYLAFVKRLGAFDAL